jgi:hypothetical protein
MSHHVGLLCNEPSGLAELLSIKSPDDYRKHSVSSAEHKRAADLRDGAFLAQDGRNRHELTLAGRRGRNRELENVAGIRAAWRRANDDARQPAGKE